MIAVVRSLEGRRGGGGKYLKTNDFDEISRFHACLTFVYIVVCLPVCLPACMSMLWVYNFSSYQPSTSIRCSCCCCHPQVSLNFNIQQTYEMFELNSIIIMHVCFIATQRNPLNGYHPNTNIGLMDAIPFSLLWIYRILSLFPFYVLALFFVLVWFGSVCLFIRLFARFYFESKQCKMCSVKMYVCLVYRLDAGASLMFIGRLCWNACTTHRNCFVSTT